MRQSKSTLLVILSFMKFFVAQNSRTHFFLQLLKRNFDPTTLRATSRWRLTKKCLSYTKFYKRWNDWKDLYICILVHFWGQLHLASKFQNISFGNFKTSFFSFFSFFFYASLLRNNHSFDCKICQLKGRSERCWSVLPTN